MAGPIPAAKTIRCAQRFLNTDGRIAQCAFYLQYSGSAPSGADLTALAGALVDAINGLIMPDTHVSWSSDLAVCTDLTSPTSAVGEASVPTAGTLTGGRLPASTALVVSSTVGVRYRGGHFRVYLPVGDVTSLLNDAEWGPTFVNTITTNWGSVISETVGGAWTDAGSVVQVAPSFYDGFTNELYGSPPKYRRVPTPRPSAVIYPVVTLVGRSVIGTQRRRLRTTG